MEGLFSEISQAALNLIYPICCQGCGVKLPYNNRDYLCGKCLKDIRYNKPPFCIRCGRHLNGDKDIKALCPSCLNKKYHFESAWQCCEYEGLIKELIHKFKYSGRLFLKDIFVEMLYNFTRLYIDYKGLDFVIPVPMRRINTNRRGFNQAALLSKGLSGILGVPYKEDCLLKTRQTKQQMSLKRDERLANIRDVFGVREDARLKGKSLLLVDDVYTTGSTVNECSRALRANGAQAVYVLTLARGI